MTASLEETQARTRVRERLDASLGGNAMNAAVPVTVAGGLVGTAIASKSAVAIKSGGLFGLSLAPVAKIALVGLAVTGTAQMAYRWNQTSSAAELPSPAVTTTNSRPTSRARTTSAPTANTAVVTATVPPAAEPAVTPQAPMRRAPASDNIHPRENSETMVTRAAAWTALAPAPTPRADVTALNGAARAARARDWANVRETIRQYFSLTTRDHALDAAANYLDTLAQCHQGNREVFTLFRSAYPTSPWLPALTEACTLNDAP